MTYEELARRINFIYDGGAVKRFHTNRVRENQRIDSHGFGTVMLIELLTKGTARKELIMAALTDDLAEQITGDIPSPAKRAINGLRDKMKRLEHAILDSMELDYGASLTVEEIITLGMADALDGLMACTIERAMGNTRIEPVAETFVGYIKDLDAKMSFLNGSVIDVVLQMWYRATRGIAETKPFDVNGIA